ncbi:MAG: hydratase [Gammaproteobacteria bacterium]|nr:hydratase [Gammaproteobacteria bacterium]
MPQRVEIQRTLTQSDFDRFAALSGDDNPIHVNPEFSAATRFGRTVSHGLLLNTILRGLVDQLVPGGRQQTQSLMFRAPTYADELIRFSAEIKSDDDDLVTAKMSCIRVADNVVTCEGETTLRRDGR